MHPRDWNPRPGVAESMSWAVGASRILFWLVHRCFSFNSTILHTFASYTLLVFDGIGSFYLDCDHA